MLRTKGAIRDYSLCIVVLTVITISVFVSASSIPGKICFIGENVRGICVQEDDCKTSRTLQHQNYICSTQDEDAVCCREHERHNLRNKLVRNVFELTEGQGRDEQLVDAETIYDVKEALEETKISDRKKHSISIATYNGKHTNSDDYTRGPIAEPNHLLPSYVEENLNGASSKTVNSNLQSMGYYSQTIPHNNNGNQEHYSEVNTSPKPQYYHNIDSASVSYSESVQTNSNIGRPLRKSQQSSNLYTQTYEEQSRPAKSTIHRTTEIYHYTTTRPSSTSSPWQEAPRPLIEDQNGYPVPPPPPPIRPQPSRPTQRPKPLKRISEVKCKEYSELVTGTVAGIPLTTDPKPVEINIQKCNYNAHQLIVGGQNASVGEFPHMAAVGFLDRKKRTIAWNCGGSLISEHFVLTAAHCTTSSLGLPTVVRLGEHNLVRGDDGAHPVDYLVKDVVKHRGYQPPVRYHDIALLRLSRTVSFTPQIRPACLYSKTAISNAKTIATGWGRIDYAEDQSDVLLKVVLSIISNQKCNELYQGESKTEVLSKGIVAQQICAGELSGGKDTCQGDSGGPIEITTQGNKCIHHVIGVTSFGKRCAQANAPGVYTRVSSYLTWIEGVVWPDLVHAIQTNHSYPRS